VKKYQTWSYKNCEGDLFVKGTVKELKIFMEFAKTDRSCLDQNQFIPYPSKYVKLDKAAEAAHEKGDYTVKDGFNSGSYGWCCENWGTKWGLYDIDLNDRRIYVKEAKQKTSVIYRFSTAWSPAIPLIQRMSEIFPRLEFNYRYYECGMSLQGRYLVKNGKVKDNMTKEYHGKRGG